MPAGRLIPRRSRCASSPCRDERGFSVIEVIIAMLILSVVVTGGVVAVASSDRAEVSAKAVADMHSIAERAFERAQNDLGERSLCEGTKANWRAAAAAAVQSGSASAATFASCPVSYTDLQDEQGRQYVVTVNITPVDAATDGVGSGDADGNLRDDYRVTTTVDLTAASKAGVENVKPITVDGSLDWKSVSGDLATVRIFVCGLNRPDRSLIAGGCAVADKNRVPLAGLKVTFTRRDPASAGTSATTFTLSSASNGTASATALVEPGTYTAGSGATFTDTNGGVWNRFRIDPAGIQVTGAGHYDVNVTYVRSTNRTVNFCTQINTPPFKLDGVTTDDGFEAYSTNVNYRGAGSPGFRSVRIDGRRDRGWACRKVIQPSITTGQPWLLTDPYSYDAGADPFIGDYDLEIERNYGAYRSTSRYGMNVSSVSEDCSPGLAWNKPLDGTPIPTRAFDPANDRPIAAGEDPSWYGRYTLDDASNHRICIRLAAKTIDRDRCSTTDRTTYGAYGKGAPYVVPGSAAATGKCFYVDTICTDYCPDGATVCIDNCSYKPGGTRSNPLSGLAAKPFGGPGDDTVGCRPKAQGAYAWYGWTPSRIWEGKVGQQTVRSTWDNYDWVGGDQYYYENFTGHYSSGPMFQCEDISFAASSQVLCEQGSNTPVYTGNGFTGCMFHYGDCIEARLPAYPNGYVRGIMRDISVNYTKPIIPSIGALRQLARVNSIARPETLVGWSPGTWWSSLNLKIWRVTGDSNCASPGNEEDATSPYPVWKDFPPAYVEVWHRIVDEPALFAPAPRPAVGNIGSDRVAI